MGHTLRNAARVHNGFQATDKAKGWVPWRADGGAARASRAELH